MSYDTSDDAARPGPTLRLLGGAPPAIPGVVPGERADAARNRKLLLDTAQRLVRGEGVDSLTMDELARRAGVGKGTVFRRFGNRSGLLIALLDHSERKFQEAFLSGPPPLGPGAEPIERLAAFGRARLLDIEVEGELHRAAELGEAAARYRNPPYNVLRVHVTTLLRAAGATGELRLLADALLAPLGAALVMHQLHDLGYTREQIADNWVALARRACAPAPE